MIFLSLIPRLRRAARRAEEYSSRLSRRGSSGVGDALSARRSASSGLPLLLRFSVDASARRGEAGRGGNDFGNGRLRIGEQSGIRVDQSANQIGGGHSRGLQRFMMIEHPSGEHGLCGLLDPLVDQSGNFLPQIGGVIEPGEFKTLQRSARSRLQIVERRSETRYGHGQSSNLRAGPKGPANESFMHCTEESRFVSNP